MKAMIRKSALMCVVFGTMALVGCSDGGPNNNLCYGINGYGVNGNGLAYNNGVQPIGQQPAYYQPNQQYNQQVMNPQQQQQQQMMPQQQTITNPTAANQGLTFRNTNGQVSYNPQGQPGYYDQSGRWIACPNLNGFNNNFIPYGNQYLNYQPNQFLNWWSGPQNNIGSYIYYEGYYYPRQVYWQMLYNYYYTLPVYSASYYSFYNWYYTNYASYSFLGGPSYFPMTSFSNYWNFNTLGSGYRYRGNEYLNFGLHLGWSN